MSFDHRFGVGISGSFEDPYIPPCCDECNKDCPDNPEDNCPTLRAYLQEAEENTPRQEFEEPPREDQGIDEYWEREI